MTSATDQTGAASWRAHPKGGPASSAVLLMAATLLAGCPGETSRPRPGEADYLHSSRAIRGAGATFPYPAYSRWATLYFEKTGQRLRYWRRGSRGGTAAIKAGEVDFGASEIPLAQEELEAHGLLQFPSLVGGVVPVYNLPGIEPGALRLSRTLLAEIYRGKITRWDHAALRRINPGLRLPARPIVPIRLPEASGTGWMLQRYVGASARPGRGAHELGFTSGVPARDNYQVARFVRRFKYTLGYVEFSHAIRQKLSWARLLGASGELCTPSREAFEATMEQGSWSSTSPNVATLATASSPRSWPITGASYVLLRRQPEDVKRASQVLRFFYWSLTEGAAAARKLGYATVHARQVKIISRAWATQIRTGGQPTWRGPD